MNEDNVANLYVTRCKLCSHGIHKNEKRHMVDLEKPNSSRKTFAFVCTECRNTKFDEEGNRL